MTVYAIGATALTGGGEGALDAYPVADVENGRPAIVYVLGDGVYHYIADADSGADGDSPNVIEPLWETTGVAYTGALRWILHAVRPLPTGAEIKILYEAEADTNAFTDDEKSKLAGIEEGADVTDADNVAAAGATMNTDADVSGTSWVLDQDDMASNDETKVPTQQSVKAYVDAIDTNLHYVPLSMSADYTIPTAQAFIGGDELEMMDVYTLTIEGTGRLILT